MISKMAKPEEVLVVENEQENKTTETVYLMHGPIAYHSSVLWAMGSGYVLDVYLFH